jgi:hypothetical protein
MKITLLTAASKEYWDVLKLSAPNKLEYCLRHGLQLSIRQHEALNLAQERNIIMREELENCQWLAFMGCDTLITNQSIDLRCFLDMIIGEDIHGINNDVFFLKDGASSRSFLRNVSNTLYSLGGNDQDAMQRVIEASLDFKVKYVPQRFFNSYLYSEYSYPNDGGGAYQAGDFLLHLPGIPNTRRIEIMTEYLGKVIK